MPASSSRVEGSPGARIVVFTGQLTYSVRKGIVDIDRHCVAAQWLIIIHRPRRGIAKLARDQWRNLRRDGWRWITHQISTRLSGLLEHTTRRTTGQGRSRPGDEFELDALRAGLNVEIEVVDDLNSQGCQRRVQSFGADLGLSLAAPILKRSLFALPRLGTLNLHKGRLPDYRGMPPAFWELWNGESSVGCSVHWVDDKLDTGGVVASAQVQRQRYSTLRGLQLELDELGVSLMRGAVVDVLAGTDTTRAQQGAGRTFRKPTLAQQAELRRRLRRSAPLGASRPRRAARYVLALFIFWSWQLAVRWILAPRITVLLYHRVSDDARDNLTVGIEQFDRQMAMIARGCDVVALEEVLDGRAVVRRGRPVVAVTFDDGYLDNCLHAAPILQRHRIPAAFFVSTGIVDSDRPFPHDVRRGNHGLLTMRWDDLRKMREQGFLIGSHTVSHIDCAAEPAERVKTELAQSMTDLDRELGGGDWVLAYPYGGRRHMTPERLELVKSAGYAACLSAYGGSNLHVDRFNVLRRGIHWEFDDAAFRRQCLGWL